jgi:aldehyde:ferredoxin oxidoreductase
MSGYMGKYLIVNLSNKSHEVVPLTDGFYRKFLSGYGLGAAVITERQKPGIDPLSPESYLGFCTGLLTGTGAFFSGRYMVVGKSPLTNTWGDANSGGFFSMELKKTGYDAVFFTGQSDKPVWVYLHDDNVEIRDASKLWGKDVVATEATIKKELGEKKIRIASIGVSGERRSLISGIVTDAGRIAARSGLGAVMGSKNLKAFAVQGTKKIPVAQPEAMAELNQIFLTGYKKSKLMDRVFARHMKFGGRMTNFLTRLGIEGSPPQPTLIREAFILQGTSSLTVMATMTGDSPIKNWTGVGAGDFPVSRADKISGEKLTRYRKRRYHCQACPLGCGSIITIRDGRFQGTDGHRPEYETLCSFGALLLHDDLDAIIELNEMCNRAGIDTISLGGVLAFAVECFENSLINERMTGGLKLGWGKSKEIVTLAEMIIYREGIGDLLADGVKRASEKIGKNSEKFAVHTGGQELPMHDSKLDEGFGIAYQCEPTPGRHTISSYLYGPVMGVDKQFPTIEKTLQEASDKERKNIVWYTAASVFMQLINCAGVCQFGPLTGTYPLVEYLNFATGWDLSAEEYLKTGERILSLRKAFTVREGVTPQEVRLHPRAAGIPPLSKGPTQEVTLDMNKREKDFYSLVGWDLTTGGPTPEKLKELGLDDLFS